MFGQNADALFPMDYLNKNRVISNAFYPIDNLDYSEMKNKRKEKLKDGEIRILGVDVALMGGVNNDNTIITCMRLIPKGDSYLRKVVYMESINGQHTDKQAIRVKQLFEDFQGHYIALDAAGNGMSIYDALCKIQYDEERDVEYDAYSSFNDPKMAERAMSSNPLPVVFTIKASGNRNTNHEIISNLRANFQSGNIELLEHELNARETLRDTKKISGSTSAEDVSKYLLPFLEITRFVNETVNLDHEIVGGKITVKEASGKRKDRFMSLAYANYLAKQLETENLKQLNDSWDLDRDYVIF